MNPEKGEGEKEDRHPKRLTSSDEAKRPQHQRNAPLLGYQPNNGYPSHNGNRENALYQSNIPRDINQRPLPRHSHMHHHYGTENPRAGKPPNPQQSQFFTRYRPFGDCTRPYPFPPPPHFPQQFQFGTFPGRNSPRSRHRRENLAVRGANNSVNNDNSVNSNINNNVMRPNGSARNNHHPDIPCVDNSVRPKTGQFTNGKKNYYKSKHHSHDSSSKSSRKNWKDNRRLNQTSQTDNHVSVATDGESGVLYGAASHSLKENVYFTKNHNVIKISKSCDESLLDKTVCEDPLSDVVPNEFDSHEVVEGAVGGIPALNSNSNTDRGRNLSPISLDRDLIDEGAIFDLDNVFQNHEISRKGDGHFANGELDSGDDLDFVFDGESKSKEYDEPLEGEKDLSNAHPRDGVNICSDNKSGARVYDVRSTGISNNCGNVNNNNDDRRDLGDSDGGEDTGDFIDTDLPSHAKHILSSSDDNQSSGKESDDEDNKSRSDDNRQLSSLSNRTVKRRSDFNSNDLSTLEPHLLNSLSHLSVKTQHNNERHTHANCGVSGPHNGTNYVLNESNLSIPASFVNCGADCNSHPNIECGSVVGSKRLPTENGKNIVNAELSHKTVYDAAVHNNLPPSASSSLPCIPNHTVCEFQSCLDQSNQANSGNVNSISNRVCSSINSYCRHYHHGQYVLSVSASGGSYGTEGHSEQLTPQSLDFSASGTSDNVAGCGGCCSLHPGVGNSAGSACHQCQLHHSGCDSEGSASQLAAGNCQRGDSVVGVLDDDQKATGSACSAEREQEENSDFLMMLNTEKSSSSTSSVVGGFQDPLMNLDGSGDSVDMVLLPMEEEIEPVLYGAGGGDISGGGDYDVDDDDDEDEDYTMISTALPARGFAGHHQAPCYTATGINSIRQRPMNAPSRSSEDALAPPHIRDPMSMANRLPSKEFYDLIKTVSSTDSCMRFFDKDGQDVQRSAQKTSNDEDTPGPTKVGGKYYKKSSRANTPKVDRVMIWNEYEAYVVQYKQIAVSACGQTAVLNVLKALKFQCEKSVVCKVIKTNLRKEDEDIPEYLFSRSCAGTTAVELMSGVEKLTGGVIGGRFFHFWPPRKVKLLQWLAYWMKRGAIPMATLNLQQGPHSVWEVPDSWHHQMVYGVSHQGLYLTNPLEIVSERSAIKQLHSDSVLLVRRQDIVSRFREATDLGQLLDHPDPRWMSMNVLGQVVNVLRECNMPSVPGYRLQVTSHVKIPASYQAGITLFMRKDQSAWNALVTASELPLE